MEKSPTEFDGSRELQCVGRMEIVRPKPVGFLCGSIPVPTDNSFHAFNSALLPSGQKVSAPRYRMLPTETDLNRPPLVANFPERVLPLGAVQSKATGDIIWEGGEIESKLSKKCEALAVSGLVEYGDEIDVIAAADILKQIFKIPYSKARLSIAVRRVGQTLVLNTGPDIEEGEKFIRRHSSQTKCADQSLFLNFAMHSVRMEACDCPPTHYPQTEGNPSSSVLRGAEACCYVEPNEDIAQEEGVDSCSKYSEVNCSGFFWGSKKNKRSKGRNPIKKATHVSEKHRCSVQESEKYRRIGNNGFLRVLFWQFHNFRMLLGSDLLLFSNEKYAAVSLHLWDVTRQVTPLNWLEAWLDNVMASVPEVAICYHQNGVVQGYELLKTDEIFLLKGISEDGTPAFHPHVVQQNGLTVLRFLQDNCKQDPGAYWLYKSAGEDVIQLFDLSVIPKNHSGDVDDGSSALPSLVHRGRSDSLFSLGTLLYRIAHRLSLSMTTKNKARCVRFFKKCLDFLDEPDHLVVRAFAHEQFARLILSNDEELDVAMESFPREYEVMVTDAEEESVESFTSFSEPVVRGVSALVWEEEQDTDKIGCLDVSFEESEKMTFSANLSAPRKLIASTELDLVDEKKIPPSPGGDDENLSMCKISETSKQVSQTVNNPISSKLAAVHHVSQAIKSLRWMRQLQSSEPVIVDQGNDANDERLPTSMNLSVCTCGDADCIEVCDIREWLPTSKLDHKLWKLVLLLGESYLALAQAYKENGELHQALKIVELASSVYGSMPKQLEDTRFISSIVKSPLSKKVFGRNEKTGSLMSDSTYVSSNSKSSTFSFDRFSSTLLFWAKAWMLVGDVYVEFHSIRGKDVPRQADLEFPSRKLQMSSEVVKEVQRLKKKLGQYDKNCSSCSLVNCSCQSDRASSGNSASSSSGGIHTVTYARKQSRRSHSKNAPNSVLGDHQDCVLKKEESRWRTDCEQFKSSDDGEMVLGTLSTSGSNSLAVNDSRDIVDSSDMQNEEFPAAKLIEKKETLKNGGIFKYLRGPLVGDTGDNLSVALNCYEEARKALNGFPSGPAELLSIMKKKGWVWNELGRNRLERKELSEAELAFAEAINAFREVSDHTNIILINCNLGHGRRALAEENVTKIDSLKSQPIFGNAYKQILEKAKFEYGESLRYYGAAMAELDTVMRGCLSVPRSLKNEVYTQFAHTYLRLGMLLGRENTTAEVFENKSVEDNYNPGNRRARNELRKHEISANEALRKALAVYESLGELRKQETAYAYFQLACYQRDCCLNLLETYEKKSNLTKGDQRVKQYASLAERNWQKAIDFYRPHTHPTMYLTIVLERSALLLSLSSSLHANMMLESALSHLFEGREVPESFSDSFRTGYPELHRKFWSQLQMVLKKMLAVALASNSSRCSTTAQSGVPPARSADAVRLRELYRMSLKSNDLGELHALYALWAS